MSLLTSELLIGNDLEVGLDNFRTTSGTAINDAVVAVTLYTASGDAISGAEGLAVTYVAASTGNYRGAIPASVTSLLTLGADYEVRAVAANYGYRESIFLTAKLRRQSPA